MNQGIKVTQARILDVRMMKAQIEFFSSDSDRKYQFRITDLTRKISADEKLLTLFAGFEILAGSEKPVFSLTAAFSIGYEKVKEDESWDNFSDGIAVSHMIPYLREFVSNMSSRLPIKNPLYLNPVNCFALVDAFKKTQQPEKQK